MTKFQPKPAGISKEQFRQIGEMLYGPNWQSELAKNIGVKLRSVQYMAAGERPVHWGIVDDLYDLLKEKTKACEELRAWLHQHLTENAEKTDDRYGS